MLKTYDGLYVFEATNSDEALESIVGRVRSEIVRLDGEIMAEEVVGKRPFARPMRKRDYGIYAHFRFQIDPTHIQTLRKRYRLIEGLMRVQIVTVDAAREALLAAQTARQEAHAAEREADPDSRDDG